MYRATAEIVDGLKVFAGGKWLTCIGNKNVRVGDRIWTDGRCVYGYHQENSSPIVITTSKEGNIVIPVVVYKDIWEDWTYDVYSFEKNSLSFNRNLDNPKRGYVIPRVFVNDRYSNACIVENVHAANIDSNGNIYKIKSVSKGRAKDADGDIYSKLAIQVLKNDTVIFETSARIHRGIGWAFIEDENKWAFIYVDSDGNSYEQGRTPDGTPFQKILTGYYCSSGVEKQIFQVVGNGTYSFDAQHAINLSHTEDFNGLKGLVCPVANGYYMTINEVFSIPPYKICCPQAMKVTLHTSSNKIIFSDYIILGSQLTVYELGSNKYLVGVNASYLRTGHYFYPEPRQLFEKYPYNTILDTTWEADIAEGYYPQFLGTGLYMCRDGKVIENLLPDYPRTTTIGRWAGFVWVRFDLLQLLNQRLRPIKQYRNWWERIKILE